MIRSIIMTCAVLAALPVVAHAQSLALPSEAAGPRPPRPISPGSWVTNDDYPAEAVRNYERGTVRFRLAVDADGKVTGCTVLTSSGSD